MNQIPTMRRIQRKQRMASKAGEKSPTAPSIILANGKKIVAQPQKRVVQPNKVVLSKPSVSRTILQTQKKVVQPIKPIVSNPTANRSIAKTQSIAPRTDVVKKQNPIAAFFSKFKSKAASRIAPTKKK